MSSELYRELIAVAQRHVDPFFAGNLVDRCCVAAGVSRGEVTMDKLPFVLLAFSTDSHLLERVESRKFSKMMNEFMAIANRGRKLSREGGRSIVEEHRNDRGGGV